MTRPHRAPVAQNGILGPEHPKSVTSRSVTWRCLIFGHPQILHMQDVAMRMCQMPCHVGLQALAEMSSVSVVPVSFGGGYDQSLASGGAIAMASPSRSPPQNFTDLRRSLTIHNDIRGDGASRLFESFRWVESSLDPITQTSKSEQERERERERKRESRHQNWPQKSRFLDSFRAFFFIMKRKKVKNIP